MPRLSKPRLNTAQRNRLDWLAQALFTTLRLFRKNQLQNHAAATAFYFLLSAAPLILLLMYAAQYLASVAEDSVPAVMLLAALYEQFNLDHLASLGLIPQRAQMAAGGVGILTLLLSSRGLVHALQGAFHVIFPDESKQRFVLHWLQPLIIIPVVFALVLLAVTAQAVLSFLASVDLLGDARAGLLKALNTGFALLVVWGLFHATLRRLPHQPPPLRPTLVVGALATLSLAALFYGFGLFFRVEKYQALYGAVGGVVFVLIGAFVACLVFYFWAQFLYALSKVDVAALEKLLLAGSGTGADKLEALVFARGNRLLARYGRTFAPGDVLIREGDRTREAFFIYAGQAAVYKQVGDAEVHLMDIDEGNLLGEMAYLLNETRTATVRAKTEVTALVLPPELLEELMRYSAPLARRVVDTLAQRLMHMNQVARA